MEVGDSSEPVSNLKSCFAGGANTRRRRSRQVRVKALVKVAGVVIVESQAPGCEEVGDTLEPAAYRDSCFAGGANPRPQVTIWGARPAQHPPAFKCDARSLHGSNLPEAGPTLGYTVDTVDRIGFSSSCDQLKCQIVKGGTDPKT